jgi:predicted Zn-dependent protease with MMP-like domain
MTRARRAPTNETRTVKTIALEVLDNLPEEFRRLTENLTVCVEDEAPPGIYRPERQCRVLAYYVGTSLKDRSFFQPYGWPDQIVLLQGPITRFAAASGKPLDEVVRICVLHELAHLLGMTHERMRELGYTFED